MAGGLARAGLTLLLALSAALAGWSALEVARNPLLRPYVDASAAEIRAATDRMLLREATPDRLAARLSALLAGEPRDWVVIAAVEGVAADRGVALPDALVADRAAAWDADSGYLARAGGCLACLWDAARCSLSQALVCQAPVVLTPAGDVAGLARAGWAWGTGGAVDEIDLALSAVGLGATALVVATGGSSGVVKVGAGLGKLARRMGLLTPRLSAMILSTLRAGVDMGALRRARSADDLARVLRPDRLAPLTALAADMGRIARATDPATALKLLGKVEDGADARRIANAAEALGPRALGRAEVLGRARFLRATVRLGHVAQAMVAGLVGLLLAAAGLASSLIQGAILRRMRRAV